MEKMDTESDKAFEKALGFLNHATTDNERLAALLLVTKSVNPRNLSNDQRRELFDVIGFKFLVRLLKTANVPSECSPFAFQAVSLSILSCFCTDDELVIHPSMIGCLDAFNSIITSVSQVLGDDDDMPMIKDCFDILTAMSCHHTGRVALCEHGLLATLCNFYTVQTPSSAVALEIVRLLVREESVLAWSTGAESLLSLLQQLSIILKEEKSEKTFMSCDAMLDILSNSPVNNLSQSQNILENVCSGLFDLLRSRIDESKRDKALMLAAQVVRIYGMELIREKACDQLLPLLVHLSCIEVRMILEDREAEQLASKKADLLTSCFSILESAVVYLYSQLISEADEKLAVRFHSGVSDAFTCVVGYLGTLMVPEKEHLILSSNCFACLRLIGAYIGEEDYAQREDFAAILKLVFDACISVFSLKYLCCDRCQKKVTDVAFSKFEDRKDIESTPDDSHLLKINCKSHSDSAGQFVSSFTELDRYISSILLNQRLSRSVSFKEPSDAIEALCITEKEDSSAFCPTTGGRIEETSSAVLPAALRHEIVPVEMLASKNLSANLPWYERFYDKGGSCSCVCGRIVRHNGLGDFTKSEECSRNDPLPDVVRFLIPGFPLICDFDQTRSTLYESKFHHLLVRYFSDWWLRLVEKDCDEESVIVIKDLCEAFLNLAAHPDLPTSDSAFIHLLQFLVEHMKLLVSRVGPGDHRATVLGHIFALGLKLSTKVTLKSSELENENHLKDFVSLACSYLSSVFEVESVSEMPRLVMQKSFAETEDLTFVLFVSSVENITELVKKHRFVGEVVLGNPWIQEITKQLLNVRGNGLQERPMLIVELENLLSVLAGSSLESRKRVTGFGCLSLASLYEMEVLGAILKSGKSSRK